MKTAFTAILMQDEVRLESPTGEYVTIIDSSIPIYKFILVQMQKQSNSEQTRIAKILEKPIELKKV